MKLQDLNINVQTNGVLSEGDFGISHEDRAHVISILRDKLYSDKFGAIVREYSSNAWDAHAESNLGHRPIKVTGPTKWEPTLSIRDYGTGLDKEGIYEVYAKYGRSTKRNSNTAIGMLGLGSKSGFAYNNTFTIISHCNGVKTTYCAYIDESNIGKISELQSVPTTETGIEIQIPIRAADVEMIKTRCLQILPYFQPMPECNYTLTKPEYSLTGNDWAIRTNYNTGPLAVMGNVTYPLDIARLPEISEAHKGILECGIDIWFPIGDLSVSASREQLEYTDVARKAIYRRLQIIQTELLANLKIQFDACSTVWDARLLYIKTQKTSGSVSNYGYRKNIVASLAEKTFSVFRGADLNEQSLEFQTKIPDVIDVKFLHKDSLKTIDGHAHSWRRRCEISEDLVIWKNDIKSSWLKTATYWRTLGAATSREYKDLLVINFNGDIASPEFDQAIADYCEAHKITGIPIIHASSVVLPEETTNTIIANTKKINIKAKAKVFELVPNFNPNANPRSSNWAPAEVDLENGKGTYLVIYGFEPQGTPEEKEAQNSILKLLMALGIDFKANPVYGIRKELTDEVGSDWTHLRTWGMTKAKELLSQSTKKQELINEYLNKKYRIYHRYNEEQKKSLQAFIDLCQEPNIGIAVSAILGAETALTKSDYIARRENDLIVSLLESDIMGDVSKVVKTIDDLEKTYPLLVSLEFFHGGHVSRTNWAAPLAEYINIIKNKE